MNLTNSLAGIGIKKDTRREYELDKLGFIHPVKKFHYLEFLRSIKYFKLKKYLIADYRNSHNDLELLNQEQNIYTIGWGDFNLVKEIMPDLREKFNPNFKFDIQIIRTENKILEHNSVAIHIRRTDFLDSKIGKRFSGICTDEYYRNAIQTIKEKVENPFFFIFSDDIEYVKNNFELENSCIIEGNAGYADLYLMSLCKHYILANSTFSFWAAMLNKEETKTVCIPEYWYNEPFENAPYIPEDWLKISIGEVSLISSES
jgi:hypothetical protein